MDIFLPLAKLHEEQQIIHARACVEEPDRTNEIVDYDLARQAFEKWSGEVSAVSGGKSLGNVRVMHGKQVAGRVIDITYNDAERAIDVAIKVDDPAVWKMCKVGAYTGLSIGGAYGRKWQDPTHTHLTRYEPRIAELSIVDRPCQPGSTFRVLKADGMEEDRIFQARDEALTFGAVMAKAWSETEHPRDENGRWTEKIAAAGDAVVGAAAGYGIGLLAGTAAPRLSSKVRVASNFVHDAGKGAARGYRESKRSGKSIGAVASILNRAKEQVKAGSRAERRSAIKTSGLKGFFSSDRVRFRGVRTAAKIGALAGAAYYGAKSLEDRLKSNAQKADGLLTFGEALAKAFDESKHKRDQSGRFTFKDGAVAAGAGAAVGAAAGAAAGAAVGRRSGLRQAAKTAAKEADALSAGKKKPSAAAMAARRIANSLDDASKAPGAGAKAATAAGKIAESAAKVGGKLLNWAKANPKSAAVAAVAAAAGLKEARNLMGDAAALFSNARFETRLEDFGLTVDLKTNDPKGGGEKTVARYNTATGVRFPSGSQPQAAPGAGASTPGGVPLTTMIRTRDQVAGQQQRNYRELAADLGEWKARNNGRLNESTQNELISSYAKDFKEQTFDLGNGLKMGKISYENLRDLVNTADTDFGKINRENNTEQLDRYLSGKINSLRSADNLDVEALQTRVRVSALPRARKEELNNALARRYQAIKDGRAGRDGDGDGKKDEGKQPGAAAPAPTRVAAPATAAAPRSGAKSMEDWYEGRRLGGKVMFADRQTGQAIPYAELTPAQIEIARERYGNYVAQQDRLSANKADGLLTFGQALAKMDAPMTFAAIYGGGRASGPFDQPAA